jgi:mono/diheme cytochrome c family protein
VAAADLAVGEGLDAALLGELTRDDGTVQATYGGKALYTFSGDEQPGDAKGHGMQGAWFAVTAAGEPAAAPAAAAAEEADAPAATDEDDIFAALMADGARVFANICAACHGANGDEVLASHVALLAGNSRLKNERLVLRRVIHGSGYMPAFGNALTDHEVAAVATFVRNSWGNEYGLVIEEVIPENR